MSNRQPTTKANGSDPKGFDPAPRMYQIANGMFFAGHFVISDTGKVKSETAKLGTTNEKEARKRYAAWLELNRYSPKLADAPLGDLMRPKISAAMQSVRKSKRKPGNPGGKASNSRALAVIPPEDTKTERRRESQRAANRRYSEKKRQEKAREANGADEMIEAAMGSLSAAMSAQAQAMKMLQLAIEMTRQK